MHTFRKSNMENDEDIGIPNAGLFGAEPGEQAPDIVDDVVEADEADAAAPNNEGGNDAIDGQFQLEHHLPNMFGIEDLGVNPNHEPAGLFNVEPGEQGHIEPGGQFFPDNMFEQAQLGIMPDLPQPAENPYPNIGALNLKRTRKDEEQDFNDRPNNTKPMRFKQQKTYDPNDNRQ